MRLRPFARLAAVALASCAGTGAGHAEAPDRGDFPVLRLAHVGAPNGGRMILMTLADPGGAPSEQVAQETCRRLDATSKGALVPADGPHPERIAFEIQTEATTFSIVKMRRTAYHHATYGAEGCEPGTLRSGMPVGASGA